MENFEKLVILLRSKDIPLDQFQDYLQYHRHPFEKLTQSLQKRQVPLKDYTNFLTQISLNTEANPEKISPFLRLESIGNYLLSHQKIALEDLNLLLQNQNIAQYTPERFFHLLLKENKIRVEDFANWNPFLTPQNESGARYRLRNLENQWVFYLETSEAEERFGPYRLLEELGKGGMGSVYKAYHPGLNQTVALKIIRNLDPLQEATFKRFQREIQIMAKLDHPGIVKIFSAGEAEQIPYFAMELVSGTSLEKQREHLYLREKLEILKKVLIALEYAHQQKVLHRDLKLENILITETREPKIADFGLAKEISQTPETLKLTQSGIVVGTAHYLSPEQIHGASSEIDERSDLYSIGVCLYRLVSGRYPHEAQTLPELFQKILKTPPSSLQRRDPKIHPDLEAIIFKSLEKFPSQRYSNAREFKKDLDHFLNGYPVSATKMVLSRQFRQWLQQYPIPLKFLYASLMVLLLFGSLLVYLNSRWVQNHFNSSFQKILAGYQTLQSTALLPIEREQKLFKILNEIHELEWAHHPQAERLKWEVAQSLLRIAYESRSFYWANYLVDELQALESIDIRERQQIKTQCQEKTQERFYQHRKRWFSWLKKIQDRKLSPEEVDEMIFEMAQIPEERIFQDLLRRIEEGNEWMAQLPSSLPSRKNELYKILVEIAGYSKNPKVIPVLFNGLTKIAEDIAQKQRKRVNPEKVQYAIFLFRSLIRYPLQDEIYSLLQIFETIGWNSLFGESVNTEFSRFLRKHEPFWEKKNKLPPELFYRYRGLAYHSILKTDRAIEDFSLALQLQPEAAELYNYRGLSKEHHLKNLESALADFNEAIRLNPQKPESYWHRGYLKTDQGDRTSALADFSKALHLNPYFTTVYISRSVLKSEMNDLLGAIEDISQAIQLNPQLVSAYITRGNFREQMRYPEGALQDFNEAIRLDPKSSSAYTNRGLVRHRIGDWLGALEDFNQAIYFDPQDLSSYINRAILKEDLKDWEGAIVDYSEGIRLLPDDSHLYCSRARAKEVINLFESALEDYSSALKIDPHNTHAYMQRGMLFHKQKKEDEAKTDFKKFLALTTPSNPQEKNEMFLDGRNKIFTLFPELKAEENK